MVKTRGQKNYSDVHMTSDVVAKKIVDYFSPSLPCLEPAKGSGVFLKSFRFFLAPAASQGIQITVLLEHRLFPHTGDLFQHLQDPLIDAQVVLFRPGLDHPVQPRLNTANRDGLHGRPPNA